MNTLSLSAARFNFAAEHAQARHDAAHTVTAEDVALAYQGNRMGHRAGLYRETDNRAQWRGLFDAACQLPGVLCAVTFIKDGGEPRTMLCQPYEAGSDATKRYVTVWDVDAGDYRRINLDAIVKMNLETHAIAPQYPVN